MTTTKKRNGRLVLNRRDKDLTTVELALTREQLKNLLDSTPEGSSLGLGFDFRVYNIGQDPEGVGHVDIAFNDPNKYFKIDRPERVYRPDRRKENHER